MKQPKWCVLLATLHTKHYFKLLNLIYSVQCGNYHVMPTNQELVCCEYECVSKFNVSTN